MLATLTSCQKQPTSAPSQKGKFSVFTLAPTNGDAKRFAWFVSGREGALTQAELKAELTWRGRETDSGQSGWSEENNRSANMIGVRVDGRAPMRDFMVLVETMVDTRLPKFALALLQEFDSSSSSRGGGDKFWHIDNRYMREELPSDEGLSRNWHLFALGLNVKWDSTTLRGTFFTCVRMEKQAPLAPKSWLDEPYPDLSREAKPDEPVFETVRQDVTGAASRLEEMCPGLSGTSKLDRSTMASWKKTRDAILTALRSRIESADHKVEFIQIGQPGFDAPLAFLLVMLESVAALNVERAGSGKAALEVGWRFQEAKGGYLDIPDSQTDPVPEDG